MPLIYKVCDKLTMETFHYLVFCPWFILTIKQHTLFWLNFYLNVVFAQVGYFISRTQQFNRTSLSWSLFELVLTTRKVKLPEEQTGLARVL